jgi:hypothetical protein
MTTDEVIADSIGEKVAVLADSDAAVPADSKMAMVRKEAELAQNFRRQVDGNHSPPRLLKKQMTGEATCVPHPHPQHQNGAMIRMRWKRQK